MDQPLDKGVVVFSGGMDSATLLYSLLGRSPEVHALGFNYGQRHRKELQYAAALAADLGVPYTVVDLGSVTPLLKGSSQTDPTVDVPEGHYEEESMKLTVVPNRNMVMLSIAAAYAISTKADYVAFGAHSGDHAIYPDCRAAFVDALRDVLRLADWHAVGIVAPFLSKTKAEIVSLGFDLGVPFEKTWSCYKGGEIHCGKCGTCVERREAFQLAGVYDATVYED